MQTFYHGSSVLFDKFDISHILEGDGKVKYGYGIYVTSKYSTAAHYAYNKKRPENKDYYVFTVEVPDKTDDNNLCLFKRVPVNPSIVKRVEEKLGIVIPEEAKVEGIPFRKYLANIVTGETKSLKQMLDKATVEGEKQAALLLQSIGVDMIEWPHPDWTDPSKGTNRAIISDENVKIIKIEKVQLDEKKHQLIPGSEVLIKEFK